jgi:pilus assembly protein FimV
MTQRLFIHAVLVCGAVAAASQTRALGFGSMPESVVFGQTLDMSVPLRLEPGDAALPGCLQADVHVGEQRVPPSAMALTLERRAGAREEVRVRIRSTIVVLEPLVAVNLSVGCQGAVTRQFVVFADPPDNASDAPRAPRAELPLSAPQPVLAADAPASAPAGTAADPALRAAPSKPAAPVRRASERSTRNATARAATAKAQPKLAQRRAAPEVAVPRLKLDEPEERLRAATLAVALQDAALASASQAASAAQAAASAAEQRMAVMETRLQSMRDEAAAQGLAMEQLRQRLAQSEQQRGWQLALAALVLALAALALWQAVKLRTLRRQRDPAWWQGAAEAEAESGVTPPVQVDVPGAVAPIAPTPALALESESESAKADAQPMPAAQRSAALPEPLLAEASLTRPVSVDELIDLEQQADFFLVLGEEEAAVDLLMAHLRSTGGSSPLPYLKLLEIYRHRQDREAYERLRKRFGQRFNAVAPGWDTDPEQGRDLLDYAPVLQALQACWADPLDAMAELENLLFRKRSGELFELPAYRDVLALYAVARDLHRQAGQVPADVDVLLPLTTDDSSRTTPTPSIFDTLQAGDEEQRRAAEDRPTAPVDLDLSDQPPLDSRSGDLRVTLP